MRLALRASLGLPGLFNVFSREASHRGLVLVEESSLDAIGQEQVSAVYQEPSVDSAHRRGGLSRKPGFPERSTRNVGRGWALTVGMAQG